MGAEEFPVESTVHAETFGECLGTNMDCGRPRPCPDHDPMPLFGHDDTECPGCGQCEICGDCQCEDDL